MSVDARGVVGRKRRRCQKRPRRQQRLSLFSETSVEPLS
jgi:hypothetical protein